MKLGLGRFGCGCGADTQYVSNPQPGKKPSTIPMLRGNLVRTYHYDIEQDYYVGRDQELGKGGCGVVVYGEHKDTHAQYAVKIINKTTAERGRLDRELKLLKDVDHVNIVRLFSVYDTPGQMYFVMELCLGGHLGNLLARQPNKYLDEDWARKLCRQIVSAVAHIHSRGIAHRDIKLQNILIDSNNDRLAQVKLIDFGYGSRYVGALPMRTKCGTPYTTAPEVIRENYDERCDVWSVGVVLYIMLCGRRPFESLDIAGPLSDAGKAAMITNILAGRFHFNHKPWQYVSKAGVNFVKTLLHHDYRTRIRSSEAMENPWLNDAKLLTSQAHTLVSAKSFNAVSKMIQVPESSEMQRTGMVALVFGLQAYASIDLRAVFQSFDSDGSGTLSRKEFQRALAQLAPELTTADIFKLFDIVDIDKNQQISYTEFLVATIDPREVDMEELNKAFQLLDEDGNGYITRDELRKVLRTQISNSTVITGGDIALQQQQLLKVNEEVEKRIDAIFQQVDINQDGCISHAEFLWAMTGLESHLFSNEEVSRQQLRQRSKSKKIQRQIQSSPNLNRNHSASNISSNNNNKGNTTDVRGKVTHQRSLNTLSNTKATEKTEVAGPINALRQALTRNTHHTAPSTASSTSPSSAVNSPVKVSKMSSRKLEIATEEHHDENDDEDEEIAEASRETGTTIASTISNVSTNPNKHKYNNANSSSHAASRQEFLEDVLSPPIEGDEEDNNSSHPPTRQKNPHMMSTAIAEVDENDESSMSNNSKIRNMKIRPTHYSPPLTTSVSSTNNNAGNISPVKERSQSPSPVQVHTPPNYKGVLARNNNFNPESFTVHNPVEVSPRPRSAGGGGIAFYDQQELVGAQGVLATDDQPTSEHSSSSSYNADKVASLFGPPPSRKFPSNAALVAESQVRRFEEPLVSPSSTTVKKVPSPSNKAAFDLNIPTSTNPEVENKSNDKNTDVPTSTTAVKFFHEDHSEEGFAVAASSKQSQKTLDDIPPATLAVLGKAKSLRSSTILDPSQNVTIKMVVEPEKPNSPLFVPKPTLNRIPSRASSFKRDISDKFLNLKDFNDNDDDVGEERADASPVPPTLAKNASARAFSVSSLLKRDNNNDPSSQKINQKESGHHADDSEEQSKNEPGSNNPSMIRSLSRLISPKTRS